MNCLERSICAVKGEIVSHFCLLKEFTEVEVSLIYIALTDNRSKTIIGHNI